MVKFNHKSMTQEQIINTIRERAELIATTILAQQEDEIKTSTQASQVVISRAAGYSLLIDIITHEI